MCGVPVHAADDYLQKLIRHRPPGGRLRTAGGSGRSPQARVEIRRAARCRPAGDAWHADRGQPARPAQPQLPRRHRAAAGVGRGGPRLGRHLLRRAGGSAHHTRTAGSRSGPSRSQRDPGAGQPARRASLPRHPQGPGGTRDAAAGERFDSVSAEHRLRTHFGVAALEAFGSFSKAETAALGGLIEYITLTQVGRMPLSASAPPAGTGRISSDRCRNARQSGTHPQSQRRPARQPSGRHRPHRHGERRAAPGRTARRRRSPIRTRWPRGSTRSTSSSPRHRCAAPCRQRSRRCPISSGPLAA